VQRSFGKCPKSSLQNKDCYKDDKEKTAYDLFRSKTPTADIYSTQTKTIVPQRPKTPLIDTRAKPRSPPPSAAQQQSSIDHENELQNALDNRYKYNQDFNHVIYGYAEMPYKPNISHLADNFNTMNLSGEGIVNLYFIYVISSSTTFFFLILTMHFFHSKT
jgi:hypothetical protein